MVTASANDDLTTVHVAYESARNELIQRLTLRDQALIAYIATAGAYFGLVVAPATDGNGRDVAMEAALVLVLPILSLVFTYVILQHHVMIGKIGEFTRTIMPVNVSHWDSFYASWPDKSYLSARTVSQALLLIMPIVYAASFTLKVIPLSIPDLSTLIFVYFVLLADVVMFLLIVRLHIWAYRLRKNTDYLRSV
jgi:hypothetical protein